MNCVTHSVKFEYLYFRKLSMIRKKVVWDKHYYSNRFTVRNIFLLCYSRFRLICIFNVYLSLRNTAICFDTLSHMESMWDVHLALHENIIPRCLCVKDGSIGEPLKSKTVVSI